MRLLKNHNGFSLMELILVISLMGIMSFVAAPIFMDNQQFNLDGAARKLESELQYIQNLAMTTGESYGFRTTGAGSGGANTAYEIYRVATDDPIESPYTHLPMEEDLESGFQGIVFSENEQIVFNSDGEPSFGLGGGEIEMNGPGDQQGSVVVNNVGLIQIVKP